MNHPSLSSSFGLIPRLHNPTNLFFSPCKIEYVSWVPLVFLYPFPAFPHIYDAILHNQFKIFLFKIYNSYCPDPKTSPRLAFKV